jgi:hypothetical protein
MQRIDVTRPPLPAPPILGGCHCGAIRYRISARPMAINACHCDDCKRLSGAPFGLYLHVPRAHLDRAPGELDVFRRKGGSGNMIPISRCRACGTRMWHEPEIAPGLVILCAGTLDDPSWAIPTSHIFTNQAAPDAVAASDALVIETSVPRPELWDRFARIYGSEVTKPGSGPVNCA